MTDLAVADIWVMDPKVQFVDDVKPLQDTQLYRVRSVDGVAWAIPLYKGQLRARLDDGNFQNVIVYGLDDATLIGGPAVMLDGSIADLRRSEGIIVDVIGAGGKLAKPSGIPGIPPRPLRIGDTVEINDNHAVVVGICKAARTFQSQPVVYTTYSRAMRFAPQERKQLSFVLVKSQAGQDPAAVTQAIRRATGLAAYTTDEFKAMTVLYFLKNTGVPFNFGIMVILGFFIGTAVAGQMFYNFTLDNLRHFGALKAMGATNGILLRLVLLQAAVVGLIGYGLGVGTAALFGYALRFTELAFLLPWWLLVFTAGAVSFICLLSASVSLRRIMRLEPAIVFKG
jgi:putative ABC transport system permease protein